MIINKQQKKFKLIQQICYNAEQIGQLKQSMRKQQSDQKDINRKKDSRKKDDKINKNIKVLKKKTKQGFNKIKNQIQSSVKVTKLLQFVKKSTKTIPQFLLTKQQSKALLPKLQKIIFSDKIKNQYNIGKQKFQQIGHQLTYSLVMFDKNPQIQNQHLQAINLQTQKCYKSIPIIYFKQHINLNQLTLYLKLTKNSNEMQQNIYQLVDYLDEVQYNIHQQAELKINIFTKFILCMDSIQDLVTINLNNLSKTRKFICTLRDIIISKSIRINQQRQKKQKIQQILNKLLVLKKFKYIENKLLNHISLGRMISHDPKSKLGIMFNQYCQIHNLQLHKFCCKFGNNLCKYWDINYFIEKGFQQNLIKMIRSYLFEVINYELEIQNIKKIFLINKKNFMTTPSYHSQSGLSSNNILDQSYDVDAYDHVQLITKIHIQKQIIGILQQGMYKYNFSTEQLQIELKQFITNYLFKFFKQILIINGVDNKIISNEFNENKISGGEFLNSQKLKQKICKFNWIQFDKIIDMISLRFEYLDMRLLSLLQKILIKIQQLKIQHSQRYQIISVYFSSLINMQLLLIDQYLQKILKYRIKQNQKYIGIFKSKQQIIQQYDIENQNIKKIVKHCKKWLTHIQYLQRNFKYCKLSTYTIFYKCANNIQQIQYLWSPKMKYLKTVLIKNTYQLFHKTFINRDLKEKIQQDNWQLIQIKTDIYNDIGYIIGGVEFLQEEQRQQRSLLSNSLLMERSFSEHQKNNNAHPSMQQYSSKFKINPSYITLGETRYKIVSSTQQLIKALRKYLQLFDDSTQLDKKSDLQNKLSELIVIYNQLIKDLILKQQAIKLGKITTKTITAKQLIIVYIQLLVIQALFAGNIIQNRVGLSKEQCGIMCQKIKGTKIDICKKYQKNIQICIMESIQLLNMKQYNIIQTQQFNSIPKYIKSSINLFMSLLLSQNQYKKFIDMDCNWIIELQNKLNKLQNGKQIKYKCFLFLENQFKEFQNYLPKIMGSIRGIIQSKL